MENGGKNHPKVSVHSGNGKLRGGGFYNSRRRINSWRQNSADLRLKLESRLGPVMLLCLTTIGTVLLINGLIHDSVRGALVEFINRLEQEILLVQQQELRILAGLESTSTTSSSTLSSPELTSPAVDEQQPMLRAEEDNNNNGTTIVPMAATDDDNSPSPTSAPSTSTTSTTTTMAAAGDSKLRVLVSRRAEQFDELSLFERQFAELDSALWTVVGLSLLGMVLLGPALCLICLDAKRAAKLRPVLWVLFFLIGIFFVIQLVLLLVRILSNSAHLPMAVDKLFGQYLGEVPAERRMALVDPVEGEFVCKMEIQHEILVQIGLQEYCLPKIKDRLLGPFIVLFCCIVAIFPFVFAAFNCLWKYGLKDLSGVKTMREKVELNQGELRPQSREEILSRFMLANNTPGGKRDDGIRGPEQQQQEYY